MKVPALRCLFAAAVSAGIVLAIHRGERTSQPGHLDPDAVSAIVAFADHLATEGRELCVLLVPHRDDLAGTGTGWSARAAILAHRSLPVPVIDATDALRSVPGAPPYRAGDQRDEVLALLDRWLPEWPGECALIGDSVAGDLLARAEAIGRAPAQGLWRNGATARMAHESVNVGLADSARIVVWCLPSPVLHPNWDLAWPQPERRAAAHLERRRLRAVQVAASAVPDDIVIAADYPDALRTVRFDTGDETFVGVEVVMRERVLDETALARREGDACRLQVEAWASSRARDPDLATMAMIDDFAASGEPRYLIRSWAYAE